jgi:hypothetical protein
MPLKSGKAAWQSQKKFVINVIFVDFCKKKLFSSNRNLLFMLLTSIQTWKAMKSDCQTHSLSTTGKVNETN